MQGTPNPGLGVEAASRAREPGHARITAAAPPRGLRRDRRNQHVARASLGVSVHGVKECTPVFFPRACLCGEADALVRGQPLGRGSDSRRPGCPASFLVSCLLPSTATPGWCSYSFLVTVIWIIQVLPRGPERGQPQCGGAGPPGGLTARDPFLTWPL